MNYQILKTVEDAVVAHHRAKEEEFRVQALYFILQGYRMSELILFVKWRGLSADLAIDQSTVVIDDRSDYKVAIRVPKPPHTLFLRRCWRAFFGLTDDAIWTIRRRVISCPS